MQVEYIKRINSVLTFIEENLDAELSLQKISDIACYSPFHMHRLFKAITNETLYSYITRKRIERAAIMLIHNKEYKIAEIAYKYGFNSDSSFSRTFKKIYGQGPLEFRKSNLNNLSKIGKVNSNIGQVDFISEEYICNINRLKNWMETNAKIEIAETATMNFAYMTQIGVNGIDNTFLRLLKWARPKGILKENDTYVCRVFHDSFKVTDADKVRMGIGVLCKQRLSADAEVVQTSIKGGKIIKARFAIEPTEFEKAWDGLFIWMNEKGYKKADRYPYEIYHNNYFEDTEKKCVVDLCIPIEGGRIEQLNN